MPRANTSTVAAAAAASSSSSSSTNAFSRNCAEKVLLTILANEKTRVEFEALEELSSLNSSDTASLPADVRLTLACAVAIEVENSTGKKSYPCYTEVMKAVKNWIVQTEIQRDNQPSPPPSTEIRVAEAVNSNEHYETFFKRQDERYAKDWKKYVKSTLHRRRDALIHLLSTYHQRKLKNQITQKTSHEQKYHEINSMKERCRFFAEHFFHPNVASATRGNATISATPRSVGVGASSGPSTVVPSTPRIAVVPSGVNLLGASPVLSTATSHAQTLPRSTAVSTPPVLPQPTPSTSLVTPGVPIRAGDEHIPDLRLPKHVRDCSEILCKLVYEYLVAKCGDALRSVENRLQASIGLPAGPNVRVARICRASIHGCVELARIRCTIRQWVVDVPPPQVKCSTDQLVTNVLHHFVYKRDYDEVNPHNEGMVDKIVDEAITKVESSMKERRKLALHLLNEADAVEIDFLIRLKLAYFREHTQRTVLQNLCRYLLPYHLLNLCTSK